MGAAGVNSADAIGTGTARSRYAVLGSDKLTVRWYMKCPVTMGPNVGGI